MGIFAVAMVTPVEVQTQAPPDEYGDESWGAARTILCRLEVNGERIRDASGIIIDVRDIVYSESPIHQSDRLTFEDGSTAVATQVSLSRTIGAGRQPLYKAVL